MSLERKMKRGKGKRPPAKVRTPAKGSESLSAVAFKRAGETFYGFHSHYDLRASIGDTDPQKPQPGDECGFWTSAGRFLTREEAVPVAVAAGQLSASFGGRELLSSDVRW